MKQPFRDHHVIQFFENYEKQSLPLDLFLNHYFRNHKSLGSKDRAYIAETIYGITRWLSLIDYLCKEPVTWERRIHKLQEVNLAEILKETGIPPHTKLSFPLFLYNSILNSYGTDQGNEICLASNFPAPITIRINPFKTTRNDFLNSLLKDGYDVSPCKYSEEGIIFNKKVQFNSLEEYKLGFFEVQDEGSQLIAALIQSKPGQLVLDYCAGAGGKTLAFAPRMKNKGQIFLYDIRPHILEESRKRLRKAGIQNAQVITDNNKLVKLHRKMDWVLVDVPCSGSGTLRRNPDLKWKLEPEKIENIIGSQRVIFEKALSFLNPKGHIVYATCSILKEENQEQIAHFLKTYSLKIVKTFESVPSQGGMDGFFGTVMIRNKV